MLNKYPNVTYVKIQRKQPLKQANKIKRLQFVKFINIVIKSGKLWYGGDEEKLNIDGTDDKRRHKPI